MSYTEKNIGRSKIKEQPSKPLVFKLKDGNVKTEHIFDKAITPSKLSDSVKSDVIAPMVDAVDRKYQDITDNLYNLILTIQEVGAVFVDGMGDNDKIGISQKGITSLIMRLWNKISDITGENYNLGYVMTVHPTAVIASSDINVDVTVDSTSSICAFDAIKIYANDVLKVDVKDIDRYDTTFTIDETSVIKCEAVMAGQTIVKEMIVTKYYPLFMGSGMSYTDVLIPECHQPLDGTLEGSYDVEVRNDNDYLFIVFAKERESEFRRADINGYEIPMRKSYVEDLVVFKSVNTYDAGTYNIDIDINT